MLVDEPRGWAEFEITAKRDLDMHGIFFEESTGVLGFNKNSGYEVVSTAFGLKAAEAKTELLVEIDCGNGYLEAYRGSLIYAKFKYYFGDFCEASCPIEQIGCLQTFRNRYEQRVDVQALATIDGTVLPTYQALPEEITLYAKPIIFKSNLDPVSDYSFTSGQMATGQSYNFFAAFDYELLSEDILNTNPVTSEYFSDTGDITDFKEQYSGIIDFTGEGIQCYGFLDIAIRLKGTLSETSIESRIYDAYFVFAHTDSSGVNKSFALLTSNLGGIFSGGAANNKSFDITYNPTVSIAPGDRIYVYLQVLDYQATTGTVGVSNGFNLNLDFELGSFVGTFTSLCNDSQCNIFLVHETLSRITEIITDNCLKGIYSEYFGRIDSEPYAYDADGCAGLTGLTNGLFIRRAVRADGSPVRFFASFKEIYEGLNAIHNIGMGPEELAGYSGDSVLRIEQFDYFYQNTILLTFNEPKEVKVEVEPSRIFSLINIGYSKWESEYTGGLDEIQTKREYKTELTATETKLVAISNLIAASYAWEITRRQSVTTTDYKYDNEIFILCLDRIYGGYVPEIWNYYADNILSQLQLYNLRITPVRNLLRWFKTIAAGWSRQFATTTLGLLFSSGEGNYIAETEKIEDESCILETQPGGIVPPVLPDRLAENENIDKNRFKVMPYPVWQPYIATIKFPLSFAEFRQIKTNPYQLLKFTQGRANYIGWLLEMRYKPAEGIADFRLLIRYDSANPSRSFG